MSILDRIASMLKAETHSFLDGAENIEKGLDQSLRDKHKALLSANNLVVKSGVAIKTVKVAVERNRKQEAKWDAIADKAIAAGKEEDAKNAIIRRQVAAKAVADGDSALEVAEAEHIKLVQALNRAKSEYEATLLDKEALVARHKVTQAQDQIIKARSAGNAAFSKSTRNFQRIRQRIEANEFRTQTTLEHIEATQRVEGLADDTDVDDEYEQRVNERDAVEQQIAAETQREVRVEAEMAVVREERTAAKKAALEAEVAAEDEERAAACDETDEDGDSADESKQARENR